jgi:hypothetical protein
MVMKLTKYNYHKYHYFRIKRSNKVSIRELFLYPHCSFCTDELLFNPSTAIESNLADDLQRNELEKQSYVELTMGWSGVGIFCSYADSNIREHKVNQPNYYSHSLPPTGWL